MDNRGKIFLQEFFIPCDSPPNLGIHHSGSLYSESGPFDIDPVRFHFRFSFSKRCHLDSRIILDWYRQVNLIEEEPIILFHLKSTSSASPTFYFLILYEWIQIHPKEWRRAILDKKDLIFQLREFQIVDATGRLFLESMQVEAKRARARRQYRTLGVPLRRIEIPVQIGRLASFEVPKAATEATSDWWRLWNEWHTVLSLPEEFRRGESSDPIYELWLDNLLRNPSRRSIRQGLAEFQSFVKALEVYRQNAQSLFPMPGFSYQELSNWRLFFQLHPTESIGILQRFFQNPNYWPHDRQRAALLLASTLANTDLTVSGRAHDLIREVEPFFLSTLTPACDYGAYLMTRQYLYVRAESEGGGHDEHVKRFLRFFELNRDPVDGGVGYELRIHRQYYQDNSDASFVQAMLRKTTNPKIRDQHTMIINYALLDIPELSQFYT